MGEPIVRGMQCRDESSAWSLFALERAVNSFAPPDSVTGAVRGGLGWDGRFEHPGPWHGGRGNSSRPWLAGRGIASLADVGVGSAGWPAMWT